MPFIQVLALMSVSGCEGAALQPLTGFDPPQEILLSTTALDMVEGDTLRLNATIIGISGKPISSPSAGQLRSGKQVTWSSSNADVVAVEGSGLVRARKSGVAVLSASFGPLTSKATVKIGPPKKQTPATVIVSPQEGILGAFGSSIRLTAIVLDATGSVIGNPSITWTSQHPEVARVDGSGTVTAMANGIAFITAVSGGVADTATLRVQQLVSSVLVSPGTVVLAAGDSTVLTATASDLNGFPIASSQFSWTSADAAVASVRSDGRVLAHAAGATTISAEADGVRASSTVTVELSSSGSTCNGRTFDRLIRVGNASELSRALSTARPGDRIQLQDGTYRGRFSIGTSGTAAKPIFLCGTRNAVIDGGSLNEEKAAIYHAASHWTLAGFTIRNAKRALLVERANHNTFRELAIYDIGQEAVHIRVFSSYNTVERSLIYNTGLIMAEWGEGIYIGSWNGHWCTFTSCAPDRSDYNHILDNTLGPNIAAEHIDIKEGSSGGVVRGNRFDGRGMVPSQPWIDAWVLVQGNGYTITDNVGAVSLGHGFKTEVMMSGWGKDNVFRRNSADVQADGFGFRIGAGGNLVGCDNTVRNAGMGFANVPCS